MMTFRKLIGNINLSKELSQKSSLELWLEGVIDTPIEELTVEDLCRAIRQKICITQLMPRVLEILSYDPLAGEYYEGELIAAISTIKENELKNQVDTFIKIKEIVNQLPSSEVNDDLRKDILNINKIIT